MIQSLFCLAESSCPSVASRRRLMKRVSRIIAVGCCGLLLTSAVAGCAGKEPTATEWGASAGGILGAGLGAIIGSQTGDASAGVAIGGIAGAGAGAVIGRSIDRIDREKAEQHEALARQQAEIESQRRELEELKRSGDSGVRASLSNRSFASSPGRFSAARDVRYATPAMIAEARERVRKQSTGSLVAARSNLRGSSSSSTWDSQVSDSNVSEKESMRSEAVAPKPEFIPASKYEADGPQPGVPSSELVGGVPERGEDSEVSSPLESTEGLAVVSQETSVGALQEPGTTEGFDCDRASDELAQARQKEESSERLFHLRRAERLCPDRMDVAIELGRVYRRLGRTEDALFEFRRALAANPAATSIQKEIEELEGGAAASGEILE